MGLSRAQSAALDVVISARLCFKEVRDPFQGRPELFVFFPQRYFQPKLLIEGLGAFFEILHYTLKKYSVDGYIQAYKFINSDRVKFPTEGKYYQWRERKAYGFNRNV